MLEMGGQLVLRVSKGFFSTIEFLNDIIKYKFVIQITCVSPKHLAVYILVVKKTDILTDLGLVTDGAGRIKRQRNLEYWQESRFYIVVGVGVQGGERERENYTAREITFLYQILVSSVLFSGLLEGRWLWTISASSATRLTISLPVLRLSAQKVSHGSRRNMASTAFLVSNDYSCASTT